MNLRDRIVKFNLSGNIEKALLLLSDNIDGGDTDVQVVEKDLNTLSWDIQRSLIDYGAVSDAILLNNNGANVYIKPILLDVSIKTKTKEFLNYNTKLYLERYKPYRKRGIGVTTYEKVKAGFTRESFEKENNYNRVNEFNITGDENTIDIKPQTYFIHNADNSKVKPIGVPIAYMDRSGVKAKQIFRFVLEVEVQGEVIKRKSEPFIIFCNIDEYSGFYYGLAFRK